MSTRIERIDAKAAAKGGLVKALWQLAKFFLVSCVTGIIQLVLVNAFFLLMKNWKPALPPFLAKIFSESTVGAGNDNWGYVLPFLLSNALANIYGYIQNRRTTFRSDAPKRCFVIYLAVLAGLILFCAWLQGVIANALTASGSVFLTRFAPTIASMAAGALEFLVLFPLEKFVLLKEKKTE